VNSVGLRDIFDAYRHVIYHYIFLSSLPVLHELSLIVFECVGAYYITTTCNFTVRSYLLVIVHIYDIPYFM